MRKTTKFKSFLPALACFASGAVLPLAFAPYHLFPIAILSLVALLALLQNATPKTAYFRGACFGLGYFGVGVSWIYIAIRYFGQAAPVLAVLLTLLLILYLALFPGLCAYLLTKMFPSNTLKKNLIVFPALWVLTEWLRGWFLTGFPWLFLGYTQINSPLSGFAPIGGVFLVSWCIAFSAGAIYSLLTNKQRWTTLGWVAGLWAIGFGLHFVQWTHPNQQQLKVSLLQGNIQRDLKWDANSTRKNIATYMALTQKSWDADFIIWPESSFSLNQLYGSQLLASLDLSAKQNNATINVGLPYLNDQGEYHNALLLLGDSQGRYFKRHLVPFGEYTPLGFLIKPLMSWLNIPMSSFSNGPSHQPLLTVKGITVAPFICYEIVYPGLVNQDLPAAQLLMTISEDAWYGDSNAVDQHLEMAQMRSLESGRYSLFAVNTGISAVINPKGQLIENLGMNRQGVIRYTVPAMVGATPWAISGNWPWLLAMLFSLLVVVLPALLHRSRKAC